MQNFSGVLFRPMIIGLVHNWPGMMNSEFEIILRIRALLEDRNHTVVILDPLGFLLDDSCNRRSGVLPIEDGYCDLFLNFHYLNPKFFSKLSYAVNWNPLDYIVNDPNTREPVPERHLSYLLDCFRSHDRLLSAGSDILDRFGEIVRSCKQGRILTDSGLSLHTTISSKSHQAESSELGSAPVNSENFTVFYIGMNWEKLSTSRRKHARHEGVLKKLDRSGRFRFYGISRQNGVFLWEGFKNFHGELPFDGGNSIINETRRSGVSLVLSSDQHRKSELVSTRIFQACAAGAIIISDRNPFVEKHFGDSVLYFDYGNSPDVTADNILENVRWIESNWDQALEKAARAQELFVQQFSLEHEVDAICSQAQLDLDCREEKLDEFSKALVVVHYIIRNLSSDEIIRFAENISSQTHLNIAVCLYAEARFLEEIKSIISSEGSTFKIEFIPQDSASLLIGTAMAKTLTQEVDYHLVYSEGFVWRQDHLFNLISVCKQDDCKVAYTPYFRNFDSFVAGQDTAGYFISGLNGGYHRIEAAELQKMNLNSLPLGNVLLDSVAIRRTFLAFSLAERLDLSSVVLVIKDCFSDDEASIGLSPVISAIHVKAREGIRDLSGYDEYSYLPATCGNEERGLLNLLELAKSSQAVLTTRSPFTISYYAQRLYMRLLLKKWPLLWRFLGKVKSYIFRRL